MERIVPYHLWGIEIANPPLAFLFGAACLLILVCRTSAQVLLTRVALSAASDLRIHRIVTDAEAMPELLVNVVTLVGMLGVLLNLNVEVLWFVLECIVLGTVTYEIPMLIARRFFVDAGRKSGTLQKSAEGLIVSVTPAPLLTSPADAYIGNASRREWC